MKLIALIGFSVLVMFPQTLWAECPYAHPHIGINPTWRPASWDTPSVGSVDTDPMDNDQLWLSSLPPTHACATPGWPAWTQSDGSPFLLLSQLLEDGQPMVKPEDPNKTLYTCSFQYSKAGGYFAEDGKIHINGWASADGPQGAWNLESIDPNTEPGWDIYIERVRVSENLAAEDFFFLMPDDTKVLAEDESTVSLPKRWLKDSNGWGIHQHMAPYFWLDANDEKVSVTFAAHDASGKYRRSADTTIVFAKQVIVPTTGDVDGNGTVDINDVDIVIDNFGNSGVVKGPAVSYDAED